MKNMIKFVLVFALVAGFTACGKNVKKGPAADSNAKGAITEITADETVVIEEDDSAEYGVSTISSGAAMLEPVYYALNQYTLSKEARAILDKNAEVLKVKGVNKIIIEGNCDDRGTISYNISLGDKRAKEVKDYYVKLGIPAANISTVSYGEEKPVCFEQTEGCWAKNRRADTVIK